MVVFDLICFILDRVSRLKMWIYSSFVYIYGYTIVTIEIKREIKKRRDKYLEKKNPIRQWIELLGWGRGRTPSDGLYREAPPESVPFFILQVYVGVGISLVEVYERVEKSVISVCKMT